MYVDVSSVHIFNPVSGEWRDSGVDFPSELSTGYPVLLRWEKEILLIDTDLIWKMEDQGWQLLDVTMGAWFDGFWDNALIVPDSWRSWCP